MRRFGNFASRIVSGLRSLMGKGRVEWELDEEVRAYVDLVTDERIAAGMGASEARRTALAEFGGVEQVKQAVREERLGAGLESVWQDLRYGVRMLRRNVAFTVVAVFALAVGIGVNTAAFTAYKAFFGRLLDAHEPKQMANVALTLQTGGTNILYSYPDYEGYRDGAHSFSGMIAGSWPQYLTFTAQEGVASQHSAAGNGESSWLLDKLGMLPRSNTVELAVTYLVSTNYFSVLGVRPIQGRTFEELSAIELANSPVVLISENFWRKRFGSDPAILGKTVRLNTASFTVIGIMPRDFIGTNLAVPAFWLPLSEGKLVHPNTDWTRERETNCCRVFGRLRPGVTLEQAQAEMARVANNLRSLHDPHTGLAKPVTALVWRGSPFPFPLQQYAGLRYAIGLIMAAVGMVLVIACANVASLQLARATSRQHELSTRLALGASRIRLIRQLLTESALLGLIAGAMALLCSWGLLQILVKLIADAFPAEYGTFIFHVTPDLQVFGYVFGLSVGASVLFGLAPALESSRVSLSPVLKGSTGTAPGKSRRLRNLLIVAQVAVSLVLMIAGSMLIRSSVRALTMETGYDVKHVLQVGVRYPEGPKYSGDQKDALARELRTRLAALPEMGAITVANAPDDNEGRQVDVALGGAKPSERNTRATVNYTFVQANYFETLGIPMRAGRVFAGSTGSRENAAIVSEAILSESAAAQIWPGQNPVGQTIGLSTERYPQFHGRGDLVPDGTGYVVVGVVRDVRGVARDGSDSKQVYVSMPEDRLQDYPILIKMLTDPNHFVNGVGPVVAAIDPDLMVYSWTLEDMLRQTEPFIASTLAAAIAVTVGGMGLLLASMGIYGTVSYIVVLRTREVGIRMALGAQKRHILTVMLRESTRPVVVGLLVGMGLSIGVSFLLRGVLYRVSSLDGVSIVGVSLLFLGIALFAAYLPSRRAMRVDPVVTLRYE